MTGSILPSRARGGQVDAVLLQRLERASGSGLVTRAEPRTESNARLQRGRGRAARLEQRRSTGLSTVASATSRCSVEMYSSPSDSALSLGGLEGEDRRDARTTATRPSSRRPRAACATASVARWATASGSTADGLEQRARDAVRLAEQRRQQMGRLDRGVARRGGELDGGADRLLATAGEPVGVHRPSVS